MKKHLGEGFEMGAYFVPICGDGNCFFTSVSTYITASDQKPYGTIDHHEDLRAQTCEYIKNNRTKDPFHKIKDVDSYLKKKRYGTGEKSCWSDWYTMCGMSFALQRPII
jgi:hypothetical protein